VAAVFKAPEGYDEIERRAYDDTEFVFLRIKTEGSGVVSGGT
jgi:hypothetical protein